MFKLFGALTCLRKIGVVYLSKQKRVLKNQLHWNSVDVFSFMIVRSSFFLYVVVTGHHSSCITGMGRPVSYTVEKGMMQGDSLAIFAYGIYVPPLIKQLKVSYSDLAQPWYIYDAG